MKNQNSHNGPNVPPEKGLNRLKDHYLKSCPKAGKAAGLRGKAWWLIPLSGLPALIWFLFRVPSKPSRLAYPCQQVAAPVAGSFVLWLVGAAGAAAAVKIARMNMRKKRYVLALGALFVGIVWLSVQVSLHPASAEGSAAALYDFTPQEGPNNPMGTARGLFPGRVVWVRDTSATPWDGESGYWWEDSNNKQEKIDAMMSKMLQTYTDQSTDASAWDALFKHFNNLKNRGNNGYRTGEKIVIKVNFNIPNYTRNNGVPSPHVVYALVAQLIEKAGVPGDMITVTDPQRLIGSALYNKIHGDSNEQFQNVWFVDGSPTNLDQKKIKSEPDPSSRLFIDNSSDGTVKTRYYVPKCFTEATYVINMALCRAHKSMGITLSSKNYYGAIYDVDRGQFNPISLHGTYFPNAGGGPRYGSRHSHPFLQGHKDLGGKELIQMLDGLYTAKCNNPDSLMIRYSTLGNTWLSSLFMAQDPVAIQSVATDLILSEPNNTNGSYSMYDPDNFLHEEAMAHNPPSQAVYDPEQTGDILPSLGVHEHWDSPVSMQYSRNLNPVTGTGIELLRVEDAATTAMPGPASKKNPETNASLESLEFLSGQISVGYSLSEPSEVTIEVFDLIGRTLAQSGPRPESSGNGLVSTLLLNYPLPLSGSTRFLVRLTTPAGAVSRSMAIVRGRDK